MPRPPRRPGRAVRLSAEPLEDRVTPAAPGGTTVAVGDLDGDRVPDLIAAGGPGLGAVVQAFSGATGSPLFAGGPVNPYPGEDFTAIGLYVAAGDIDADGRDELFVSPDLGGGARVQAFSLDAGRLTRRANFFAIDDPNFRGGGRIAVADVDGDGRQDLVAGAGFSGGPRVAVYGGRGLAANGSAPPRLFNDFFAFEPTLRDGVYAAAGDLTADGRAELIFGGGPGGGPRVLAIDPTLLAAGRYDQAFAAPILNLFAFDAAARNGVIVAAANADADAGTEVLAAEGPGPSPTRAVALFGPDGTPEGRVDTGFDPGLGYRLAAGDFSGDGQADVIVAPASGPGRAVRAFRRDGTRLFEVPDPFAADARIPRADSPPAGGLQLAVAPAAVSEAAGPAAAQLTVTRSGSLAAPLAVRLSADRPADATVPASVVIPAGAAGATVPVGVTDNAAADGSRAVTLSAAADGLPAATATLTVTDDETAPPAAGSAAGLLAWNDVLLDAVRGDAAAPPVASRAMAMLNDALYDADNGLGGRPGYLVGLAPPAGADPDAAAAAAGHRVLGELFPAQQARFDAERDRQLGLVADGPAKAAGAAYGRAVADAVIALRRADGSDGFAPYTPGSGVGAWEPTAPAFAEALLPEYAAARPFALDRPDQFRPPAPPAVGSADWAAALDDVWRVGAANSGDRTDDQTAAARVWADGSGTATPPGRWLQIAVAAARERNLSRADTGRLLAALATALADTSVAAWDAKYAFGTWRPITAIREADRVGDPALTPDTTWTPLLVTPNHPEYVSGHSSYSRAAAVVLERFFGSDYEFGTSTVFAGATLTRTFAGFAAAADEAGRSRVYGGIHFEFSNQAGQQLGRRVAEAVLATFDPAADAAGPAVTFDRPSGTPTNDPRVTGRVTDRQSGVRELTARVAGGDPVGVPIDRAAGTFALAGPAAEGTYAIEFTAVDLGGRASTFAYTLPLDRTGPRVEFTDLQFPGGVPQPTVTAADPAGLTALTYSLDEPGGPRDVPLPFDPAGGAVAFTPDFARSSPGNRTVTVTARDAAGNTSENSLGFLLADRVPLAVAGTLPRDGAADVGATYRPRVSFTRPVAGVSDRNVYAVTSGGDRLGVRPVLADDGSFAWVFFPDGLPGGEAVTLVVDGDGDDADPADDIRGAADGVTLPGTTRVRFTTVSRTADDGLGAAAFGPDGPGAEAVAGTTVTGVAADPGPDLKPGTPDDVQAGPDGVLMTADDVYRLPLAGVTVFALGREGRTVRTNDRGEFTLTVPAGVVKLAVDGRTATNAPAGLFFPEMVLDLTAEPLAANTPMGSMGTPQQQAANEGVRAVYLPRLAAGMMTPIDPAAATAVRPTAVAAPNLTPAERAGLALTVPAGTTALAADGTVTAAAEIGLSTVPPELVREMLPPGLMQHTFDVTVQAPGVSTFAAPLPLTVPNTFAAAPGTRLNLLSFDHTTGRLEIEGTMTVSADGATVTTDPGVGVTHPGWHGATPPGANGTGQAAVVCEQLGLGERITEGLQALTGFGDGDGLLDVLFDKTDALADAAEAILGLPVLPPRAEILFAVTDTARNIRDAFFNPDKTTAERLQAVTAINVTLAGLVGLDNTNEVRATKLALATLSLSQTVEDINKAQDRLTRAMRGVGTCRPADQPEADRFLNERLPEVTRGLADKADRHTRAMQALAEISRQLDGVLSKADVSKIDSGLTPEEKAEVERLVESYEQNARTIDQDGAFWNDISGLANELTRFASLFSEPVADRPPAAAGGPVHWAIRSQGQTVRGQARGPAEIQAVLAANQLTALSLYEPATGRYGTAVRTAGASGTATSFGLVPLLPAAGPDADGDGLPDAAEAVAGTSVRRADTDGDGVSDLAELRAGTNPLGTRQAVTGVVGRVPLAGPARAVAVADRTAFVATGGHGLAVVDVADPASPTALGQIDLDVNDDTFGTLYATRVAIDPVTATAVVAGGDRPALLVDVSDPTAPAVRAVARPASQPNPDDATDTRTRTLAVAAAGGLAFVADRFAVRVFEPVTGTELSRTAIYQVAGLAAEAGRLYALTTDGTRAGYTPGRTLQVFDIVGDRLVARGAVRLSTADGKIVAAGGLVYAAATRNNSGGYVTVDVSDPDAPREVSGSDVPVRVGVPRAGLAVTGSGLGLLAGPSNTGPAVDLFDARNPDDTFNFVTRFRMPGTPRDVVVADGVALVATDAAGLTVLNFRSADTAGVPPAVALTLPTAADGTAVAGGRLPVRVTAADDVQVARVELLLDGRVVAASTAPPFDLSAVLPAGGGPVTLRVRATDTGGNVGLSAEVVVALRPDQTAPAVTGVSLAAGAVAGRVLPPVLVRFSEPLDPASVTADRFRLAGPAGDVLGVVRVVAAGRGVAVEYPPLPADGAYQLVVSGAVRDAAGNPVGADAAVPFQVAGGVFSRFDVGTDGWAVADGATGPTFVPGGPAGGYVTAAEARGGVAWYWVAPAEFLGPKAAAVGRALRFDLRVNLTSGDRDAAVVLTGGGLRLEYRLPAAPPAGEWRTYAVPLAPDAGWTVVGVNRAATLADFRAVLADLTELRIRGEYSASSLDAADLDNVVLEL